MKSFIAVALPVTDFVNSRIMRVLKSINEILEPLYLRIYKKFKDS